MATRSDDKIYPGQNVDIDVAFRDAKTRGFIDPGFVSIIVMNPQRDESLAVVERLEQGKYVGKVVVDVSGDWEWRAVSDAPGQGAQQGTFRVEQSSFTLA